MDFRGDGVGKVAIIAGSTGKSSVLDSMGSILISYPLAAPENCKTFEKDDAMHTEIEMFIKKLYRLQNLLINYLRFESNLTFGAGFYCWP